MGKVGVEGHAVAGLELVAAPIAAEHDGALLHERRLAAAGLVHRRILGAAGDRSPRGRGIAAVRTSTRWPRRAWPPTRRSAARTIVTEPLSSRRSSCERRRSR